MNTDTDARGNREEGEISAHSRLQCYREKEDNMDLILKVRLQARTLLDAVPTLTISSNLLGLVVGRHQI